VVGLYGGGGRAPDMTGGSGAVRIIWGNVNVLRAFPTTSTIDL
jgi:hypothetical protein